MLCSYWCTSLSHVMLYFFFFFGMGVSFQWCVWIGLVSIFLLYVIHDVFLAYIEGVWLFLVVFMVPSVALYILDYL